MFELLNKDEVMNVSAGYNPFKELGNVVGWVVAKVGDGIQIVITETALAVGDVATTTAAMLTDKPSIMQDYQDFYMKHSVIW